MKIKNCAAAVAASALSLTTAPALAQEDDESHHTLDNVIVTATPLERTVEQLAQPTSVLFGDELATKQSSSIGELLSREAGVTSSYFGPVSSRPVIRGQYGERVRVLSNGLDSLDASALSEDHQVAVEGLLAERVEIVRGPATLLYGSGAAGGLVNVVDNRIVREPLDKPFDASIALGSDSATGRRDAAIQSHFGTDSVAFSADFFTRETDNVEIPGFAESKALRALEEEEEGHDHDDGDDLDHEEGEEEEAFGELENSDSETYGGAVGVSFLSDNGFFGISASVFDSEYGIPGGHHHHHEEEDGDGMMAGMEEEEEEEEVRIDLEQVRFDVQGDYDFDGDGFFTGIAFRAAVNDYEHTELEGDEIGTQFDVDGIDSRVELRHGEPGGLQGAIGVQYETIDFVADGDEAFVPPSDTERFSLFAFEEMRVSNSFVVQGSARYEQQTISGSELGEKYDEAAFGFSLGGIWQLTDALRLSSSLALTERHPTATELYADGPHIAAQRYERGSVTLGDGVLDQEVSTNFDVTLHGDYDRFEWSATAFVNSVSDYILLRPTPLEEDELQVFDFDQTDAQFTGFELEGRFEVWEQGNRHLHIEAFVDRVVAEEDSGGAKLPRIPPSRIGLGIHGGVGSFTGSIDAIFADDQDDVAENELPTEGYTRLDVTAGYRFSDPGLYVFVRGTNLLDEDIRQHSSALKDIAPLPGQSIQLGLRYDF